MKSMAVLFRSNSGAKPNAVKGFYTVLAMFLPLLVLTMLGQRAFGVLVLTGALLTSFGDIDTSYRIQSWSLGMTAAGGATECRCDVPGCAAGSCIDCWHAERFGVRADRSGAHAPG